MRDDDGFSASHCARACQVRCIRPSLVRWLPGLAMVFVLHAGPAAGAFDPVADTELQCPAGDEWNACQAEKGDPMALYALAREAYEDARTS